MVISVSHRDFRCHDPIIPQSRLQLPVKKQINTSVVNFGCNHRCGQSHKPVFERKNKQHVLFPILNGGVIVLSGLAALFLFKEKLTRSQYAGIILGTLAICLLGI